MSPTGEQVSEVCVHQPVIQQMMGLKLGPQQQERTARSQMFSDMKNTLFVEKETDTQLMERDKQLKPIQQWLVVVECISVKACHCQCFCIFTFLTNIYDFLMGRSLSFSNNQ